MHVIPEVLSPCSCEDRSQQLPTLSNIHPGGEQAKGNIICIPTLAVLWPRLSMIQEMWVHPIYNTAVLKTEPRLPTSLPGPLEVSSQVLISPRPVLPQPPGASSTAAGPYLPTWNVPASLPGGRMRHTPWFCSFDQSCGDSQWHSFLGLDYTWRWILSEMCYSRQTFL